MEQMLFKAQGVSKKQRIALVICSLIILIGGIFAFPFSQIKKGGYTPSPGGGNITYYSYSSSSGGYRFDKDERQTIIIIGVILIIFAVMTFEGMLYQNKSYITVYENHVECMAYIAILFFIFKKPLNTSYDKIKDVQFTRAEGLLLTDTVFIITETQRIGMSVNDAEQAYQIIKQRTGL